MGRPQRISDSQIDVAARRVFLARGPAAPVAEIAGVLGVSHAALLQRAGSKEQLLRRALGPRPPAALEALRQPPPEEGAGAALVQILEELRAFHQQMLPGLMVLKASGAPVQLPPGATPPTVALRRLLARWLWRATRLPVRRCALRAEGLLGAIEARCFNAYLGGPDFVEGDDRRFVRALVDALVPELRRKRGAQT